MLRTHLLTALLLVTAAPLLGIGGACNDGVFEGSSFFEGGYLASGDPCGELIAELEACGTYNTDFNCTEDVAICFLETVADACSPTQYEAEEFGRCLEDLNPSGGQGGGLAGDGGSGPGTSSSGDGGSGGAGGVCDSGLTNGNPEVDACLKDSCCAEYDECSARGETLDECYACLQGEGGFICDSLLRCQEQAGCFDGICESGVGTGNREYDACLGARCCSEFTYCSDGGANEEACLACFDAGGGPLCDAAMECEEESGC